MEREFEWDIAKAAKLRRERGLDLVDVTAAFDDPDALVVRDARSDYGEDRYVIVGKVRGRLVTAVFTLRGERIRLITAWPSHWKERERYARPR